MMWISRAARKKMIAFHEMFDSKGIFYASKVDSIAKIIRILAIIKK